MRTNTFSAKAGKILFLFGQGTRLTEVSFLPELMAEYKGKFLLNAGTEPYLSLTADSGDVDVVLKQMSAFVEACLRRL